MYLRRLSLLPERVDDWTRYPFSLPCIRSSDLRLDRPLTVLVGENGTGKSTRIEAIAELVGLPVGGGSKREHSGQMGPEQSSLLAGALRPSFQRKPRDAYFFRADHQARLADLLESRAEDPYFEGRAFHRYGGSSLLERSHGEGFLDVLLNVVSNGLYLLDEPESALSPRRQARRLSCGRGRGLGAPRDTPDGFVCPAPPSCVACMHARRRGRDRGHLPAGGPRDGAVRSLR